MNVQTKPDAYGELTGTRDVEDPAASARSDRAHLGVSHGWRTAPQVARAGQMEMKVGAPFEFVWRNHQLNDPPSARPADFPEEHRMQSRITELDPPRKLSIAWNNSGDVTFELEPKGEGVLLHRDPSPSARPLDHAQGQRRWHMHLDILVARVMGTSRRPFWEGWSRLQEGVRPALPPDAHYAGDKNIEMHVPAGADLEHGRASGRRRWITVSSTPSPWAPIRRVTSPRYSRRWKACAADRVR